MPFLPIIIFLLILSFLVFIHELGHFLSARKFGVDVEEFGLGIPPRAIGRKWGKTLYSLNWLPLGGFVKIKGEDYEGYNPKDKGNFINKKPWQRAFILTAGIMMNLAFAFVLFYILLGTNHWQSNPLLLISDYQFKHGETINLPNVVTFIEDNSPAKKAGLEFADRIESITYGDSSIQPKNVDDIKAFMADKDGKQVTLQIKNINTFQTKTLTVTPEYSEAIKAPAMGVGLGEAVLLSYANGSDRYLAGFMHAGNVLGYSFDAMKGLVRQSVDEGNVSAVSQGVSGPVGIFGAVRAIIETGGSRTVYIILDLMAVLSLSLAIMNLLPIPALDGGRLAFVLYEWITGRKPSAKFEARTHQIGYLVLLGLIIVITFKDIFQFF